MDKQEFIEKVTEALNTYISDEELYDDNAQLVIAPQGLEVTLEDGDEEIDDLLDQYDVMDLLRMDADGKWEADTEAVAALAEEYFS